MQQRIRLPQRMDQAAPALSNQSFYEGSRTGTASNHVQPATALQHQRGAAAPGQQAQQGHWQVGPGAELVSRRVVVYWGGEGEWFPGVVTGYQPDSGLHRVDYDDEDVGHLLLSEETWLLEEVFESLQKYAAPGAIPSLLHHLQMYSTAAPAAAGGGGGGGGAAAAGLQPLIMPHQEQTGRWSMPAGPRVLWWWPCRPLDRVNDSHMSWGSRTTLGLDKSKEVQVSIWALSAPGNQQQEAAAAAAGPGAHQGAAADADAEALAAVVHERVPGAWQQLHSFSGKLYFLRNRRVVLGGAQAVQCLRDYPGWHLLRMELLSPEGVLLLHALPPGVLAPAEQDSAPAAGGAAALAAGQQPVPGPLHPHLNQQQQQQVEEENNQQNKEDGGSPRQPARPDTAPGLHTPPVAPKLSPTAAPKTPAAAEGAAAAGAAAAGAGATTPLAPSPGSHHGKRPAAAPAAAASPGGDRCAKRPASDAGRAPTALPSSCGAALGGIAAAAGPSGARTPSGGVSGLWLTAAPPVVGGVGEVCIAAAPPEALAAAETAAAPPPVLDPAADGQPDALAEALGVAPGARGSAAPRPAAGAAAATPPPPAPAAPALAAAVASAAGAAGAAGAVPGPALAAGHLAQGSPFSRARKYVVQLLAQIEVAQEVREAVSRLLVDPGQRQLVVTWAAVLRAAAGAGDMQEVAAVLRDMVEGDAL